MAPRLMGLPVETARIVWLAATRIVAGAGTGATDMPVQHRSRERGRGDGSFRSVRIGFGHWRTFLHRRMIEQHREQKARGDQHAPGDDASFHIWSRPLAGCRLCCDPDLLVARVVSGNAAVMCTLVHAFGSACLHEKKGVTSRSAVLGQAIWRLPAAARRRRVPGTRGGPRDRPADPDAARRAGVGAERARQGRDVLLFAAGKPRR